MLLRYLILIVGLCFAQTASAWNSPKVAIQKFLTFEVDGGRLKVWPFNKYLAVKEGEYDEPGWDVVHLIQDYKIQKIACLPTSCVARVQFTLVPTNTVTLKDIIPHPNGGIETVEYRIILSNKQWLLEPNDESPRIYVTTYRRLRKE